MGAVEKITETVSDGINHISEVVKERLFSPMYFYFLIAWVITNWKFVSVLLFTDESALLTNRGVLKNEYLSNLYSFGSFFEFCISVSKLIIIPAVSSFLIVWYLSRVSTRFYRKNEEYMMSKRIIQNDLVYTEKVHYAKAQRDIREAESDKKEIRYSDNKEFNESYDYGKENVVVGEYDFLPSEVLYNNDYEAYKEELEKYKSEHEIRIEDVPF